MNWSPHRYFSLFESTSFVGKGFFIKVFLEQTSSSIGVAVVDGVRAGDAQSMSSRGCC